MLPPPNLKSKTQITWEQRGTRNYMHLRIYPMVVSGDMIQKCARPSAWYHNWAAIGSQSTQWV